MLLFTYPTSGSLAQLARAPRLHRGGRGFEPLATHQTKKNAQRVFFVGLLSFRAWGENPQGSCEQGAEASKNACIFICEATQ